MVPRTFRLNSSDSSPKVISYFLPGMLIFSVLRFAFFAYHFANLKTEPVTLLVKAFLFGAMIDSSITATTLLLFFAIESIALRIFRRPALGRWLGWGIQLVFGVYFLINAADIFYFQHAHTRFNMDVIESLRQFGPIWQTIIESKLYLGFLGSAVALFALTSAGFARLARLPFFRMQFRGAGIATFFFLLAASFLYLGEPFWRLSWVESGTQAARQLKLNGVYSLVEDFRVKAMFRDEHREFANLEFDPEAFARFKKWRLGPNEHFTSSAFPLSRRIDRPHELAVKRPNIVLITLEGFSASRVGALRPDRQGLSPNIDRLAKEGILFKNFYAHETRTHHGVVGITASFPSLLGTFLTRRYGTASFYTGFNLLREYGYKTSFIYGFDRDFDNKASYFSQGGVDEIIDQQSFTSWKYKGVWGVSDEDVFIRANERFRSYPSDQPFVSMILTGSNHAPYHLPDYFAQAQAHASLRDDYDSTFRYSDWAVGRFMELAKKEAYFDNTIFVFVADHGEPVDPLGRRLKRFHIPLVIYAPKLLPKPQVIDSVGAQVDIMPTLFHLIGYPYDFPFVGKDLLTDTDEHTGHVAVMRDGSDFLFRWRNYLLIEDIQGQSSRLYTVKDNSYRGGPVQNPEVQTKMKRILKNYVRGLYYVFYNGLHQVEPVSSDPKIP